ncbi:hypothetical protein V8C37DRAFT_221286 [Trichoderma ceciliae]
MTSPLGQLKRLLAFVYECEATRFLSTKGKADRALCLIARCSCLNFDSISLPSHSHSSQILWPVHKMDFHDEEAKSRDSDRAAHIQKVYGRLPSRGDLLGHQLERRTYFDSGDFALSKARKPSSIGNVITGSRHPCREGISHPFCSVPSQSNVSEGSNRGFQDEDKRGDSTTKSHLHEIERDEASRLDH